MPTFLDLANRLASDSATADEGAITSVAGQTGRKAKAVRWTAEAWLQIQNAHAEWLWMQSEFSGSTVIGQARYVGTAFTDSLDSAPITRFSKWDCSGPGENRFKLYRPSVGLSDAGRLIFQDWREFYARRMNNGAPSDKPAVFSIDPQGRLVVAPAPDDVYSLIGPYRKSAQTLTADGDIPEMPVDFHDLIVSIGLQLLGSHDEAPQIPLWKMRENRLFCELEAHQLPTMRWGRPLA